MKSKRLALYARCSTLDQHADIQLHALRQYTEVREAAVVAEYIDHGVSGAKDRRPGLDRMVADARRRLSIPKTRSAGEN